MAVAYYEWNDQVFERVDSDQVAYIITAVGAPSKGIVKVGMWITDTSFSAEHDPSLSNLLERVKKLTVSNAPAITISKRIAILNTLKACSGKRYQCPGRQVNNEICRGYIHSSMQSLL